MSETELNDFGRPVGCDYNPRGDMLSLQEAVDRIGALERRASGDCYLPEHPDENMRNAGRVRAFAQALALLERAGLEPDDGAAYLTDEEVMRGHD